MGRFVISASLIILVLICNDLVNIVLIYEIFGFGTLHA